MKAKVKNTLFRTNHGYIFEGKAKIGDTFKHNTTSCFGVIDTVVTVGNDLKDLIQVGDIIEYDFTSRQPNSHGQWLCKVASEKDVEYIKSDQTIIVKRIFCQTGKNLAIESAVLPSEYTKKQLWLFGEKL